MKPVLHLNLHRKWFDMIKSGEKTEEYRETRNWSKRMIFQWGKPIPILIKKKGVGYDPADIIICFSNGYSRNRDQFYCKIKYLKIDIGQCLRQDWGAETDIEYFAFGLEVINYTKQTA